MANYEMIKQAYAQGAYAALKEAGYDHQTAEYYAIEMAKQADGPIPVGDITKNMRQGTPGAAPMEFPGLPSRKPRVPNVRPEPSLNPATSGALPTAGAGLVRPVGRR